MAPRTAREATCVAFAVREKYYKARCANVSPTPGGTVCAAEASFPDGTGGCSACPHDKTSWSAYQGLVFILCGVFGFVGIVYLLLTLLVARYGGSIRSTAGHAGQLLAWAITMLQGVAQVAAVTSSSLPPFLARMFSSVSARREGFKLFMRMTVHPFTTPAAAHSA